MSDEITRLLTQVDIAHPQDNLSIKQQLALIINDLLGNDFSQLVQLLYVVDVDEQKLRLLLSKNQDTDAADLIAELLIKRQEEKLKFKKTFRSENEDDEVEKW